MTRSKDAIDSGSKDAVDEFTLDMQTLQFPLAVFSFQLTFFLTLLSLYIGHPTPTGRARGHDRSWCPGQ